ncbi:MAG: hypothetical protein PHD48_11060 [Alphaproteobacteria bacterium]|nr:hypothetical protein [Alphaproteobacteria bacterium]
MKTAPSSSLVPHVITLAAAAFDEKFVPYQRMAGAIIDLTNRNGACEPKDLLALGFSHQETIDLWHMANAIANVELRLMN